MTQHLQQLYTNNNMIQCPNCRGYNMMICDVVQKQIENMLGVRVWYTCILCGNTYCLQLSAHHVSQSEIGWTSNLTPDHERIDEISNRINNEPLYEGTESETDTEGTEGTEGSESESNNESPL